MSNDSHTKPSLWKEKPESWHEPMEGVRRRILAHSPTGMMVLYKIQPGRVFPLHNHPHAQFGIFLEGSATFRVGDSVWKIKEGDTYFIPPGVLHELRTDGQKVSTVIDFFTPERPDYLGESLSPDGS